MKRVKNEDGAVAVILALVLVSLLAVASLVVDRGALLSKRADLQNAADAAALACAYYKLDNDGSVPLSVPEDIIEANGFNPGSYSVKVSEQDNTVVVKLVYLNDLYFSKAVVYEKKARVAAEAAVEIKRKPFAVGYSIFAEDDVNVSSGSIYVYGDMYAGGSIKGNITSDSKIESGGSVADTVESIDKIVTDASEKSLPKLARCERYATVVDSMMLKRFNYQSEDGKVEYDKTTYTLSGDTLIALIEFVGEGKPLYFKGKVYINGGECADGSVIADGNIIFTNSEVEEGDESTLSLVSINGNISFNCPKTSNSGILCAPNGTVNIRGKDSTLSGAIAGKNITVAGEGIDISYDESACESIQTSTVSFVK